MLRTYNSAMGLARLASLAASRLSPCKSPQAKVMRFARGQQSVLVKVAEGVASLDRTKPVVWLHAASLGEFGIARPIITELKRRLACNVVVTFFSPTGYEAVSRDPGLIDCVLFLPLDTHSNAERFLDIVKPDCAVFMVSEYWHNYLHLLGEQGIPSVLVSAIIRDDGPFFKWYGRIYRQSIRNFSSIFTLDRRSIDNLKRLGIDNARVNGDPLFDNVMLNASTPWRDETVERFKGDGDLFIAGSIHNGSDLEIVTRLANSHPDLRFVIVPHEVTPDILNAIESRIDGKCIRYSQCHTDTPLSDTQVLIVDHVGSLARLYRYATIAYVGGGFTRLLHSVIEPAVYGIPVAFGPNIHRKVTPNEMIELGIGTVITDTEEADSWLRRHLGNKELLDTIASQASSYVQQHTGATPRVVNEIIRLTCGKN